MTNLSALNAAIKHIHIPSRMRRLPISDKGFPVPWFVAKLDGEWDFRVIKPDAIREAIFMRKCWLCGQPLGTWYAFTVGPMCVVNRCTAEPPEHVDCAQYAVRACPFLSNPRMKRNEKDMPPEHRPPPGEMIKRNPGAVAIYITRAHRPTNVGNGVLFFMEKPERVEWYAEGREASRAEVLESINSGMPLLRKAADKDGAEAHRDLDRCFERAMKLLPA